MVDPADTDAHAPLARVALFTGDANEARERVKLARSVNPNCRWAIGVEALILLYGARPAEARQAMEHRIRIDRRHAGPWHEIAISYYYEREYPRAVEAARR